MIDYKKYIKVLGIIKNPDTSTPEMKASAICELFDQEEYENVECDQSPNDFQYCGCPKGVTCPGY